ncbi:MAG: hypothetical protein RLZZ302_460, partial [Actinomycetota bacterium]
TNSVDGDLSHFNFSLLGKTFGYFTKVPAGAFTCTVDNGS